MSKKPTLEVATAAEKITFTTSKSTGTNDHRGDYARRVAITLEGNENLPMLGVQPMFLLDEMKKRVLRAVRGHTVGLNIETYAWNAWGECRVTVIFLFAASSAKKIISEARAWDAVYVAQDLPDEYKTLEELIEGTIRRCLADEAETILAKQRSEQAQEFAARIARHCDEEARKSVNLGDRLAALREEVRIAREAILPSVLAEIPERGSDGSVDPRVIAEAKAIAPAKVAAWKGPTMLLCGDG